MVLGGRSSEKSASKRLYYISVAKPRPQPASWQFSIKRMKDLGKEIEREERVKIVGDEIRIGERVEVIEERDCISSDAISLLDLHMEQVLKRKEEPKKSEEKSCNCLLF